MTQQDMEIWKAGYDLQEKYQWRQMTALDWQMLANDCRDLYEKYRTPLGLHMSMMVLDLFADLGQKKPEETEQQMSMGV